MTNYDKYFSFSGYDIVPESWHFSYEPPIVWGVEQQLRWEFPATWKKVFHVKAFTVEEDHNTKKEDIIFWGAVWLTFLGIGVKIGLFIGWR